jgi:hypothetical protein
VPAAAGSSETPVPAAAAGGARGGSQEDPMKELDLDMLVDVDDGNILSIFD